MSDDCELCGGKGEIETVDTDGCGQVVPCPECVSEELHGQLRSKDCTIVNLRVALVLAEQEFREYEATHRAKGNDEKADRSKHMLDICNAALKGKQ